jgi:predicted nucleic acid-binding protein
VIVLDASAWVSALTTGNQAPELGNHELAVPPHFDSEVLGSVRALQQRETITTQQADDCLQRHLATVFERIFDRRDIRTAWRLRASMSFADAWYVALAERLGVSWLTADEHASRTAGKRIDVRLLTAE